MILDTLEILIEADSSGLQTQMKRAGQQITSFVNQMNSQEVNWTQILSRSISPAIISGIATMFALAITKSLQFEETTKKVAETSDMTGEALSAMQNSSKALSSQTGIDAKDIARAYGSILPTFRDTAVANAIIADATKLSVAGFGNLGDIVKAVLPLMQKWGVSSVEEAHNFMDSIADASANSGKSLADLASGFDQHSDAFIRGGLKLKDFNNLVVTYGVEIAKIGSSQADAVFSAIGDAVSQSNVALAVMLGGSEKIKNIIVNGGMATAIKEIGDRWAESGAPAQFVAQQFGLSETAVNGFIAGAKHFDEVKKALDEIASSNKTVNDRFNESVSGIDRIKMAWQTLVNTFTSSGLAEYLSKIVEWTIKGATGIVDMLGKSAEGWKGFIDDIKQDFKDASDPTLHNPLANSLRAKGFDDNAIKKVEDKASGDASFMGTLIKALQSGIQKDNNSSFINTFNLTVPKGSEQITAESISSQLYKQFMGTH